MFFLSSGQRGDPDDRLARAARQDDHARAAPDVAAGVEGVDGHPLVVADLERVARRRDLSRRSTSSAGPLGVAGEVFGRVADGDQGLLEDAPEGVVDGEAGRVEPLAEVVADPLAAGQFFEQRLVVGDQPERPVDPDGAGPGRSGRPARGGRPARLGGRGNLL